MSDRIELVGAAQAAADLRRWGAQLGPAVGEKAEPFGHRVADTTRGRVPHISGRLAGSIESTRDEPEAVAVGYDGSVPYDGWVEFGGTRGRPYVSEGRYLYPTAEEMADDFERVATDAANDSVRSFHWSTPAA